MKHNLHENNKCMNQEIWTSKHFIAIEVFLLQFNASLLDLKLFEISRKRKTE